MQGSQLIDTHAHIYLPEFEADLDGVLEAASAAGVSRIFMPAIDSGSHAQLFQLAAAHPHCKSMMGLHPCSVKENVEEELLLVEQQLASRNFIAVGEIGLDFYWDLTYKEQQFAAFRRQLELAVQYNLPVSIHSRNATDECIAVVAGYPGLRGVFHCFSGTVAQAKNIIDQGLLLGIGGVLTFKNAGLDKVITEIGLASVVLETDAPYLAPVPHRGKRNQPSYIKHVAEKLSALLELPFEEVAAITTTNAEKLFGFEAKP